MGYNLEITRNPIWSGRPGTPLLLEEWFDVIQKDDELQFAVSSQPKKYPTQDAEWLNHPTASKKPEDTLFYWAGNAISCKYPDEQQMAKMVQISRRLKAVVVGDNGERYDLDPNGKVVVDEKAPADLPRPMVYGAGARSCADFTQAITDAASPKSVIFYNWYLGVVTAVNAARHQDGKSVMTLDLNAEVVREDQTFLAQYCREHPERSFHQAALTLLQMRLARCPP
ncbi:MULTISPECIES: hypothetical protein [Gluconobacter]|uniref:Uncharacterized protein n=1 Tax=Gluconobacter cadivus TaxID=2728101 RepID=A0ABR9YSB2_9PROT|nr:MULTISPECIES: hypothetical protein [Gluconobacter]MBF0887255.1 hypothetical protein [Gluconobacter cadivus]MBS1059324.1 hypothetical protein [Gluconobacter sp. Dm-44]